MVGFGVISPCDNRSSNRLETVGWASPKRWSGRGSPYRTIGPVIVRITTRPTGSLSQAGVHSLVRGNWSYGRPRTDFGITWTPRRAASTVDDAWYEASTAMSTAELPMPSTTTRLPASWDSAW